MKAALVDGLGLKPRKAFAPVRVAVTGRTVSPPLYESMELLGRERAMARLGAGVRRSQGVVYRMVTKVDAASVDTGHDSSTCVAEISDTVGLPGVVGGVVSGPASVLNVAFVPIRSLPAASIDRTR